MKDLKTIVSIATKTRAFASAQDSLERAT
jgi:hypothetical protein